MVERYGTANGFGWKLNDIVTAQVVSVPVQLAEQRARGVFWTFMVSLGAVFALFILSINLLLITLVVRPVNQLSSMANSVSLGNSEITDIPATGKDEIADLSHSFNRMGRSLVEAMKLLRT